MVLRGILRPPGGGEESGCGRDVGADFVRSQPRDQGCDGAGGPLVCVSAIQVQAVARAVLSVRVAAFIACAACPGGCLEAESEAQLLVGCVAADSSGFDNGRAAADLAHEIYGCPDGACLGGGSSCELEKELTR
jgi:hypothetical protein